MLTVYGCPATRATRATWALEEAGASYEYVKVDLMKGGGRKPPFIELNPAGKVPALGDDDFVLTESAAIVTYVGDKFPASRLTPAHGSKERALYNKWCFYVIGELEQPLWTIAKHTFALPEQHRVGEVIGTAKWEFTVALKALDKQFGGGPFILGEQFTAADILIGHTLGWALRREMPIDSERLRAYADRVLARPARQRAQEREAQS